MLGPDARYEQRESIELASPRSSTCPPGNGPSSYPETYSASRPGRPLLLADNARMTMPI
jgi:hypothetical protein